jgi:hypothetical protein
MDEETQNEPRYERIDGVAYLWGSAEHDQAIDRAIEATARRLVDSGLRDALRADANQTAFLARDLVYVSRDVQKVLYDMLKAALMVPTKSEVPRGAKQFTYRQQDIRGEALAGADLSADDAPNADVGYEEFGFPVTHVVASYQYTLADLEAAAFSGIPLTRDKANAAAELIARKLDKLIRSGLPSAGIQGFFNNASVPDVTLTNGEWLTATADEILADLAQIEQAVIGQSRDNHAAIRLLLPTAQEGRLRTLKASTTSDPSVATYFLQNARSLREIMRWIALDDATGTDVGVADPPMGIAYSPNADQVYAELPVPYEELPPQARNFAWVVPCRAVFGGVVFKRPLSAAYIENLD